jgi:hypothetical protein
MKVMMFQVGEENIMKTMELSKKEDLVMKIITLSAIILTYPYFLTHEIHWTNWEDIFL